MLTGKPQKKQLLEDPDIYASSLLLLLFDNFDKEVLDWSPPIIQTELEKEFGTDIPSINYDKINAALSLFNTNLYHVSLEAFASVNNAFSGRLVSPSSFYPNTPSTLMWGVTESLLIEGPEEFQERGFSHNIALYTGYTLALDNIVSPPKLLGFAEYSNTEPSPVDMSHQQPEGIDQHFWELNDMEKVNLINENNEKLLEMAKEITTLPLEDTDPDFIENIKNNLQLLIRNSDV